MSTDKPYPLINKVGLELEGGWRNRVFHDADIHDDISVPRPAGYDAQPFWHYGEIASPPLEPEEAVDWLVKHYPLDIPEPVDGKSCGFHIHISPLSTGDYNKLLSQTFHTTFLKRMDALLAGLDPTTLDHYYLSTRLKGQNRFARRLYAPSRQVWCEDKDSGRDAERRTLINYCHGLHGTVEVRLFPMFQFQENAIKAVLETLGVFNSFLSARVGKHDRGSVRKAWVGDLLSAVR